MKIIKFGKSIISDEGPCYVIAEIGHNHQGDLSQAIKMIEAAAQCGANAVKFQKRNNPLLFTNAMYQKPYDHENSFGRTYGEHREKLELTWEDYLSLKKCAEANDVEFICAPFDSSSVDFLVKLGVSCFKFASGDITNIPLLVYAAKFKKPMFLSTGASTFEEIKLAYESVHKINDQICLMHCVSEYPAEYNHLNLNMIKTLKENFPDAVIGYSSHDNGILAPSIAYLLGATVLEKHFTLNRAWKGTDHKFSLQPEGLRKQIRDLKRMDVMLGSGIKKVESYEKEARSKMGKSIYLGKDLPAGHILQLEDLVIKSPAEGLKPYQLPHVIGKKLKVELKKETLLSLNNLEDSDENGNTQTRQTKNRRRYNRPTLATGQSP